MPKGWKELPIGGLILEPGCSAEYETGDWRSLRPVLDAEKCSDCMLCWIYCPDASIVTKDGKMLGFDLKHCKGCGICGDVCPVKAITFIDESVAREEES